MYKVKLIVVSFLCLGFAWAQPLTTLAPADSLLSLSWSYGGSVYDTLKDDFAELDWQGVKETLSKIALVMADTGEFDELSDMMAMFSAREELMAEAFEACPGLESLIPDLEAFEKDNAPFEALLTVSASPFSPVPSGTALFRTEEGYTDLLLQTRDVLLDCARAEGTEITTLEQDDVTLYVVGDAGDFPIVIGNLDNIFMASTDPEALRAVVRLASGTEEASLATSSAFTEASSRFAAADSSAGLSLNFAGLADVLEGFSSMMIDGPETEYLIGRTLAMLRTLGAYSGQISVTGDGLVSEGIFAINEEGGDEDLLEMVLCQTCQTSSPFLAPDTANSISGMYIPWRELYAYAESWVDGLSETTGEPIDVKQMLRDELGLDLDVALFNWLGSEAQTYVLEPYSTKLETLVYSLPQVTIVPVSSPEAAEAAFEEWIRAFEPFMPMIMEEADLPSMMFGGSMVSARDYSYKGVDIRRLQFSYNADVSYAFLGNYMVFGTPYEAIHQVIDTFQGERSALSNSAFRASQSTVPDSVTTYGFGDTNANLRGLADLYEIVVQPAAFGIATLLQVALEDARYYDDFGFDEDFDDFYTYDAYLDGITAETMEGFELSGMLDENDGTDAGFFTDYLELPALTPGDTVEVSLISDDFDTYIYLIDATQSLYINENDDAEGDYGRSAVSFDVEEGTTYWVEVTSFGGNETGNYQVVLEVSPAAEDMTEEPEEAEVTDDTPAEAPSFAELLNLFDLLPKSMNILADHTSTSESYSTIDGSTVYVYSLTRIVW